MIAKRRLRLIRCILARLLEWDNAIYGLGNLREALKAFERALEIHPGLYSIAHTILQIQDALREQFRQRR